MAIYTFSYTEGLIDPSPAFPSGATGKHPMLRVTPVSGASRVSCLAAIDTMADYTLFPKSYMALLGIDPSTALQGNVVGVGSQPEALFQNVEIEVEDFLRLTVFGGFMESLDAWGIGLLGYNGFIDRVKSVGFHPDFFGIET